MKPTCRQLTLKFYCSFCLQFHTWVGVIDVIEMERTREKTVSWGDPRQPEGKQFKMCLLLQIDSPQNGATFNFFAVFCWLVFRRFPGCLCPTDRDQVSAAQFAADYLINLIFGSLNLPWCFLRDCRDIYFPSFIFLIMMIVHFLFYLMKIRKAISLRVEVFSFNLIFLTATVL